MHIRSLTSAEWPRGLVYLYAHLDEVPGIESAAEDLKRLQKDARIAEGFIGAFLDEADGEEFISEDMDSVDRLVAVLWSEEQPGNTLQFRTPAFAHLDEAEEIKSEASELLFEWLDDFARARKCDWIQTLLDPTADSDRSALTRAGYTQLAQMSYQLCTPEHFPPMPESMRLTMRSFAEIDDETAFAKVIGLTYEQTEDCPALQELRTNEQMIDGYYNIGDSGTHFWWLAELDHQPVGCMLLAKHNSKTITGSNTESDLRSTIVDEAWCELVYWGIIPKSRHQGLGSEMLSFALHEAGKMNANKLILAVDANNEPALSIYQRLSFIEWLRQEIWVKGLSQKLV